MMFKLNTTALKEPIRVFFSTLNPQDTINLLMLRSLTREKSALSHKRTYSSAPRQH